MFRYLVKLTDLETSWGVAIQHTITVPFTIFYCMNTNNKKKTYVFPSLLIPDIDGAERDRKTRHKFSFTEPMAPSM